MRKRFLLLPLLLSLYGCGEQEGIGSVSSGYYFLSLDVGTEIISPSVGGPEDNPSLPSDSIAGSVRLGYTGSGVGMKGFIRSAELCVERVCYSLPISGVLFPNGSKEFDLEMFHHKFTLPWLRVNPLEDRIVSTQQVVEEISAGNTSHTANFVYSNAPVSLFLNSPVVSGQVFVRTSQGTFRHQVVQNGYSAGSQVNLTLDKGVREENEYVRSRVFIGNDLACEYDYANGQLTEHQPFDCTYNPTPTGVVLSVTGFEGQRALRVQYDFRGELQCLDSNGQFGQDCGSGSINYSTGQLSNLTFRYSAVNVPLQSSVFYQTGGLESNNVVYVLPLPSSTGFVRTIAGRVVEVLHGSSNMVLCNNSGNNSGCSMNISGNVVNVSFQNVPSYPLKIRYTLDRIVNFNPNIDLSSVQRDPFAVVDGRLSVRVMLESGEVLNVSSPIRFRVVPR